MSNTDTEREPLLKRQTSAKDDRNGKPQLAAAAADPAQPPPPPSFADASPIVRVLLAIRAGHLPDNGQLYALLHASAAFCESISRAVIPSTSTLDKARTSKDVSGRGGEQAEASSSMPGMSDDTTITLAAMLKESATLFRTSASWLYGGKDTGGEELGVAKQAKKARDKAEKDDDDTLTATRKAGARGNEHEQWQRLLWHMGQALSSSTEAPISIEVDGEVQGDARQAAEAARDAAVQVGSDAKQGFMAMCKMIALLVKSDEVLRIPSDVVQGVSNTIADVAAEVAGRAEVVEETLRQAPGEAAKPDASNEKNQKASATEEDFVYPKEALQDAVNKTSGTVDAVISEAPNGKGKHRSRDDDDAKTWEDEAARRAARLLEELKEDETFRSAADRTLRLTRKYMAIAKQVRDDVDVSADTELTKDAVVDAATKGAEKARESLSATLASTHLDAEVSAHLSHHATEALRAGKEVLEGLAGGTSLNLVVERASALKEHIQSDSALRKWTDDLIDFLSQTIRLEEKKEGDDGLSVEEKIKQLYARLQQLLNTRPAVVKAWEDLQRSMTDFGDALRSDVVMRRMRARLDHITGMAKSVLVHGARDAKQQASSLISTLLRAALPSIGQVLGKIPLPRVEFASDKLDAVVDDIHISALDLVPDVVRVTTTNDWTWHRQARSYLATKDAHLDSDVRLFIGGLRLAVSDVSFYVQERFTAPSAGACGACCSFGHSDSDWCLFRGPASWLAYTESALLDVGFAKQGAGVTIDLRDAGQDLRRKQQAKSSGWWPFGTYKDDEEVVQHQASLDDVIRQYQGEEEAAEVQEDEIRTRFFDINDCQVHIDDSFDFRMRNSRHWLMNAMLRLTVRPIVKVLLRRVIAAQMRHALQLADERAYDIHLRAKLVRHRKMCRAARTAGRSMPSLEHDVTAGLADYAAVLMDSNAGKSKARLHREREEQREAEERARKEEEEREREEEEAAQRRPAKTQQPQRTKAMEVKPSGVIYHDEDGDFSVAIGVKPSGLVLEPRQHGPMTSRMKVRDAIANPKRTAQDAQRYGTEIGAVAKDRLRDNVGGSGDADDDDEERDLLDGPRAVARKARRGVETVQDTVQGLTQGVPIDAYSRDADDGWKSSEFDL